jgi:hypothetical protein
VCGKAFEDPPDQRFDLRGVIRHHYPFLFEATGGEPPKEFAATPSDVEFEAK